jgi:hypothetical protein
MAILIGIFIGIFITLKIMNRPISPNPTPVMKSVVLESSFFPFKSITLRGILKILFFSIVLFYMKSFIYPFIVQYITNNLLHAHILCSFLTFLISSTFNETLDYIVKDVNSDFFKKTNFFNPEKDSTNNMKVGESSKMGESSKAGESSKSGRIITDSDYESGSDSSIKKYHPYTDQIEEGDGETNTSKLVNSNLPEFKETVKSLTNEEIVETMNTIDCMREEYQKSNVPSAKSQIENLNIKEGICASQLEENLTEKDYKGKGKEVDTSNEKDYKGKGKGKDINSE